METKRNVFEPAATKSSFERWTRLLPGGERFLLHCGIIMLISSLSLICALEFQWPRLTRVPGAIAFIASPTYALLAVWQLIKYGLNRQRFSAALLLGVSTLVCSWAAYRYAIVGTH